MTNIWGFLLQTLTVSGVALVLLIIKRLLRDKVSPDMQYVFWLALAVRMLLPVRAGVSILFSFPVWVETLKAKTERALSSAYSGMYELVDNRHVLPVCDALPVSVTDWLFVIYVAGIAVVLLGYALAYISLRIAIARADEDAGQQARADEVAKRYGLHTVRVRVAKGIRTPFVCGVLSPVLVLPKDRETDGLVILHELLHREHHDPAKSMCWCVLRALHWCNPFLWYVVNRIENDLETCNDQRVLACVEGEQRRAYGNTLLSMATSRYARMPGTSSISNGRKNIARRIEAIVRFKTYPKGVTFALVCIALVLGSASVRGETLASGDWQHPKEADELDASLAKSRVRRATTLAGALDTFAKGLLFQNGIYLAMASPLEQQAKLYETMKDNPKGSAYLVDWIFQDRAFDQSAGYRICNLRAVKKAGLKWRQVGIEYEAALMFSVAGDNGEATLMLPVRVWRTPREGWVVERAGEEKILDVPYQMNLLDCSMLAPLCRYDASCDYGTVEIDVFSIHEVEGNRWGMWNFWDGTDNSAALPDAEFEYGDLIQQVVYDTRGAKAGAPEQWIGIIYDVIPDGATSPFYLDGYQPSGLDEGGSSNGCAWVNESVERTNPRGVVASGGLRARVARLEGNGEVRLPNYGARIYWDNELVDEIRLDRREVPYDIRW